MELEAGAAAAARGVFEAQAPERSRQARRSAVENADAAAGVIPLQLLECRLEVRPGRTRAVYTSSSGLCRCATSHMR